MIELFNEDCMDIMARYPDNHFELAIVDPPYGIGINKSHRLSVSRGFAGETWDNNPASKESIETILKISKNQVIWGGNYFNLPPTRCFLVWDKKNDGRDFADCELAWTSYNGVARMFHKRPMGMDGGKVHPTQKPVYLFSWILGMFDSNTVLDPYLGSGTTGVAAELLNRRWIGIEISEKYCEISAKRIESEASQLKLWGAT